MITIAVLVKNDVVYDIDFLKLVRMSFPLDVEFETKNKISIRPIDAKFIRMVYGINDLKGRKFDYFIDLYSGMDEVVRHLERHGAVRIELDKLFDKLLPVTYKKSHYGNYKL